MLEKVDLEVKKKPKLLWLSDSPRIEFVGQSVVTRECLKRLQKWYDVIALGYGDEHISHPVDVPYQVISCQRSDFINHEDIPKAVEYIKSVNPDVVLFSHDPWLLPVLPQVRMQFPDTKFIGYLTVDGEPAYCRWRSYIRPFDKIVVPTQFSKTTLLDRWLDLNIDIVPYGLDHEIYHPPKQGKALMKKQLQLASGGRLQIANRFVGIFVGANQDRKNLGLLHEAWREFEKGKEDNVTLLVFTHSASLTQDVGSYDLPVFTIDTHTLQVVNEPQPLSVIAPIMCASDVLCHFSNGGGFELTCAESMAAGTIPVVLNYAGVTEFCDSENCYEVPYILHVGGQHVHRAVASVDNAVEQLNKAYYDADLREKKAQSGIEAVKRFTWDNTADGLHKSIQETLSYNKDALYVTKVK